MAAMTAGVVPYYHPCLVPHMSSVDRARAVDRTADPALGPWLSGTGVEAEAALARLLEGPAADAARDTVRRALAGSPAGAAHVDDVLGDVRVRLVRKLRAVKAGEAEPIADLAAYAAVVAENACYALLRAQYPERTRFRNKVRYIVTHHPGLGLVQDDAGIWRCQARGVRPAPVAGSATAFLDDPSSWMARHRVTPSGPLPPIVAAVLAGLDRPVEFDRLVDALAFVFGIADPGPARRRDDDAPLPEPVDLTPGIADQLEQRDMLVRVWHEIVELPPRQRAALLLNLRDPDGGAVVHLLPGTGVTDQAGIAAALELPAQVLSDLWDTLPMDDLAVAARLGITRQQVINLRKSARARLARRLGGARP